MKTLRAPRATLVAIVSVCGLVISLLAGGGLAGANVPGPPVITNVQAPTVQSVGPGQVATFQAIADETGVDLSAAHGVGWQVSADRGTTWTNLPSSAGTVTDCAPGTNELCSQFSFTATLPENQTIYRVLWAFYLCQPTCHLLTHASQAAVLFVGTGERTVAVTKNPSDATVAPGQSARFSAAATGNPAPVVQWYQLPLGSDQLAAVTLPTGRSTTLVVPAANAMNGTRYEAYFLNWLGLGTRYQSSSTATTTLATLTVTG